MKKKLAALAVAAGIAATALASTGAAASSHAYKDTNWPCSACVHAGR